MEIKRLADLSALKGMDGVSIGLNGLCKDDLLGGQNFPYFKVVKDWVKFQAIRVLKKLFFYIERPSLPSHVVSAIVFNVD